MARNDQEEAFEKILTGTLIRVTDLLRFAEAKNGTLLAVCSAWLLSMLNMIMRETSLPEHYVVAMKLSIPWFLLADLIVASSFLPKMRQGRVTRGRSWRSNLLFFGDIGTLSLPDFQTQLKFHYFPAAGNSVTDDYISDITSQIHVISQIAMRKFRRFEIAAFVVCLGVFFLALPIVYPPVSWLFTAGIEWLKRS